MALTVKLTPTEVRVLFLVKGKGDDGLPASEAQGTIATSLHALQSFGLVRVDRSFGAVRWKLTGIGASLSADVEFTL